MNIRCLEERLEELKQRRNEFKLYKKTPFVTEAAALLNKDIRNTRRKLQRRKAKKERCE